MRTLIGLLLLAVFYVDSSAISKIYSGMQIPTNTIKYGMQFIEKGKPLMDLTEASTVVYFDEEDHSLKFTILGIEHPDSVFCHVIPGDQISVQISCSLLWDDQLQQYHYRYNVHLLEESIVSIEMLSLRLGFEPIQLISNPDWDPLYRTGAVSWSRFIEPKIEPGNSITDIGFDSKGPPKVADLYVLGEMKILKGAPEYFESYALSSALTDHSGLYCVTLIPSPIPERIEAANWISSVVQGIDKIVGNGYIPKQEYYNVRGVATNLHNLIYNAKNPPFTEWNAYIESALSDLEPFESLIEPEAYSYITENLKYMQRHKDIVWFRK